MVNLFKYGFFSFPAAISLLIMQIYIPSYIAQMGVFSLTAIGLVFFAARLIDMVTDLLIGYASDITPPKYGRRRMWILLGTPVFLLIFYQLLAIPSTIGALFVIAALWYVAGTCMIVPYYTWGAEIEKGYDVHTKYTGARVIFGLLGSLCALILPTLLMPDALLEDILNFNFILVTCFFAIALGLLVFLPDAGRVSSKSANLRDLILIFEKGSCFNQLISSQLFNGVANALPATLFIFFTTYVLKRPDLAGPLLVVYFLSAAVSVPIWVKFSNIWRKERCWQVAMITAAITFLGVLLVDENSITLFFTITVITGLMAGADLSIPASMLADIVDHDAKKNGSRRPGIYFAVWGTTSKLTLALAVVIAFSLLGMDIFEQQQLDALVDTSWLVILYALLPPIFKIISVALLVHYKLEPDEGLY
tara:strand:+ start:84335 stop:85594 length:1260 start_codon:yes stop_codon:yes gene_type:complete